MNLERQKKGCPVHILNWASLPTSSNRRLISSLQMNFLACIDITFVGEGVMPVFTGTNADDLLDRVNENESVADLARLRGPLDGLDGLFHVMVAKDDVELNAWQKIHSVGSRPSGELNPALTAVTANFDHIHPDDADIIECLLDIVEFFLSEDHFNFFRHGQFPFVEIR